MSTDQSGQEISKEAGSAEIERKFLLEAAPEDLDSLPSSHIEQGYLAAETGFEARVRRLDDRCFLTIKRGEGLERLETEITLEEEQFGILWQLTEGRRVRKRRYRREVGGKLLEIDVYEGALEGLVVAEIEFDTVEESRAFEPPGFLWREITGDSRYANKRLAIDGAPH